MALLEEIEPPSLDKAKDIKNTKFMKGLKSLSIKAIFKAKFSDNLINLNLEKIISSLKNFVSNSKYLPHIALISLGIIVSFTNIGQKIAAKAYDDEMVTLNPDTIYAVSQTVDEFTPIIKNDSQSVEKVIVASSSSDGFIGNLASVSTEITDRATPPSPSEIAPSSDNTSSTIKYVIQDGDTLTGLGWKFGIKLATLKYVNNIDNENLIKPGLAIKIPPKGYEVSAAALAKRENDKKAKLAAASRNTVTRDSSTNRSKTPTVRATPGSKSNGYPYGWCTYHVATKRAVPVNWGDARAWLGSAKRAGYQTGSAPAAGAIVVTNESFWGHVAYVESVDGNNITISEMNYKGWGVTSRRTISANDGNVRGFIY